ncbi:MAG: glutathione synthase [Nitrospinae bacterium]|nr:glutathione synthase [Nitrospinota bacterium]
MSLAFAFVLDPFDALEFVGDTSFCLMAECQRRGHAVFAIEAADLAVDEATPTGRASPVEMDPARGWVPKGPATVTPLGDFDCVFMRKEPPFDMSYIYATYVLEFAPAGTFVINDPRGLRNANEKLYSLHFPALIPESLVARTKAELTAFMERVGGSMVIKPLGSYGGQEVFVCRTGDTNLGVILDSVTDKGRNLILAQRYLPEVATEGDKRILVLDGEPIGAFLRRPSPGDHRANISAGGSPVRQRAYRSRGQALETAGAGDRRLQRQLRRVAGGDLPGRRQHPGLVVDQCQRAVGHPVDSIGLGGQR